MQNLNAHEITAKTISIPNDTLNTSTITCYYMNVWYIEYPGGIRTNVSTNIVLVTQNLGSV